MTRTPRSSAPRAALRYSQNFVVLGLSEGRVQGTDRQPARRNAHLQAAADFTEPPVRVRHRLVPCRTDDGAADHLLLLEIEPGDVVHATRRDEVFLRVGDETRKLRFTQRQELVYDKGQSTYETSVVVDMGSRDLAGALVQEYAAAADQPDGWRLLESRGLTRRGGVTVAGCLLFAPEPQACFPNAHLRVLRWRGGRAGTGSRQQLLRDVRLEGPLTRQIAAARDVLREIQ